MAVQVETIRVIYQWINSVHDIGLGTMLAFITYGK